MSFTQFENLPDEDILKIFSFLDIKDILQCSQVSKRLWSISKDESLWLKLNLFQRTVPSEFIQKASENGCKYLSIAHGIFLHQGWKFEIPLNFKYLDISQDSKFEPSYYAVPDGLLENCYSLEKLSMEGLMLNEDDFGHLAQVGQTLKVLNLEAICGRPYTNYGNCMEHLMKKCAQLTDLNFSNALRDEYVTGWVFLNSGKNHSQNLVIGYF